MTPDVSRALALFVSRMGLGQKAARELAEQYGSAKSASDLPEWLTEEDEPPAK